MSRNSLTKPSNCTRTQHEHRSRSFDPSGARAEDGQGRVGTSCCAGKKRVACAFSNPAEQKKSHWTVPAPALLSPLMQPSVKAPQQSSPSPGTESSNPARSSGESCKPSVPRRVVRCGGAQSISPGHGWKYAAQPPPVRSFRINVASSASAGARGAAEELLNLFNGDDDEQRPAFRALRLAASVASRAASCAELPRSRGTAGSKPLWTRS